MSLFNNQSGKGGSDRFKWCAVDLAVGLAIPRPRNVIGNARRSHVTSLKAF